MLITSGVNSDILEISVNTYLKQGSVHRKSVTSGMEGVILDKKHWGNSWNAHMEVKTSCKEREEGQEP